jgi:uncharacterized membrane protein YgaE (UPF0421/DUF939 family)
VSNLRAPIEARLSRLRREGLRGLVRIEADTLLRIVKATVAAALAWEVGSLTSSPRPVLASLGAVLVVQVTVRATLARTIQLTIGVTVGLVIAVLIGHALGVHWWSIGLVVLGGLVVGEVLRLGAFSSQVAISALLAYSLGSGYGAIRAVDTAVGAVIGAAINVLIPPPSQVAGSARTVRGIAEDLATLLADIAEGLARPLDTAVAQRWLDRGRDLSAVLREADDGLTSAQENLRFNHRGRTEVDRLDRIAEGRRAIDHAATQTRGIIRTLLEASRAPSGVEAGPGLLGQLSPLVQTTAAAVGAFGRLQADPASTPDREHADAAAADGRRQVGVVSERLAGLDMTDPVQAGLARQVSSILVDADRLLHEVDVRDGAHATATAPS